MTLTFYYGNNGSISTDFNIKDYSKKTIYYSNLKHADNSVNLSIPYSEQIQNILNANADENIKAEITDGTSYIFTGYLRKDFSFGKKQRNQPISLEIVSPSYILDVNSNTIHSERNKKLSVIVTYLLSAAGFTGTYDLSAISGITVPLFIINEGDNIRSVLDQILFEYGFQYDFSDAGLFSVYPIFSDVPADKTTISQTFDGSNCIDEIKISKKEQQYNGTKVSYEPVSLKNNVIVFADTTNGDANGLTCNIELPAHSYLGDLEDGTTTYYIDYDSTEGEVKWAENVSLIVSSTNNNGLTKTFTNHGTRGEISIYNNTNAAITITKIQVKGSAYVSKETAISVSSNGRKFYEYSAKYLQSAPQADTLSSNYTNWQNYADYTMDVKSSDDFVLGSFVKVEEVGLATMYGRIVEKTERLDGKPIQYKIEAISDYAPSSATTTVRQRAIFTTIGLKGDKGDTGEQGPQGPQGETGGQGAKGDTGVSMRNKGNWESGIAYVNNSSYIDVVYYAANGCSYACKKSHTSANAILPTNTTYWNLLAEKGDTGAQGPQGIQGIQGEPGAKGTRGTLTFSGTEIGDIRASAVVYTLTTASTGITSNTMSILVGDRYINSLTGDVWKCTTAGTASTAKWTYDGRQSKDSDSSNQWRFFGEGTKTKYNAGGTNISQTEVTGEGPFGGNTSLLKITRPANAASNGRVCPYSKTIKLEAGVSYRYACYAKKTNNGYINYFGCRGWEQVSETVKNSQILTLSGAEVNSGYFCSSTNFGTVGRWYLVIGYVTANGVTTLPANDAGVYDMVTKQRVATCNNYQFKNITEFGHTGTLIEYSANSETPTAENTTYIYDIRFDKMDGTQPSLNELLAQDTDVKSKGAWASGTVYYIGDIVSYTNGNSYICKANHTASSSILPTNTTYWNLVASKGDRGYSSRTIAFRVNYSAFSTTNNGEVYTCGYNSSGAEADTYGYVIVNGTTYYAKGMTNTNIACDGYLVIPTTSTSSGSPSVPVVAYENGNDKWYYIRNDKSAAADYTVAIAAADKSKWVVLAKVRQSTGEGEITLEPMTACLLSSINQPINYYYEGIVAAVTQYTSASITPYKITQSSGTFSKTAVTARYAKRGAVVLNTNAVTPTSSTAAVKFQFYNGTDWNEVTSTDARFSKFVALSAGDLPGLAGYYTTLGLTVPSICGTYIDTLTSNKAFIDQLFANNISVGNTIQSSNYAPTTSSNAGAGFKLSSDGTADINQITINGMRLQADLSKNIIFGDKTMENLTNGLSNVSLGYTALRKNTEGSYNIAIGNEAMYSNTEGSGNIAIGAFALSKSTTTDDNIAIGYAAGNQMTGFGNIAIGSGAMLASKTGDANTAIGRHVLSNSSSNNSTGIGYMTLYKNTTGTNTAVGCYSSYQNTTGTRNTAIGYYALYDNTTGNYNIALGHNTQLPPTWNNSINLNNTIIHLEFHSTCTQATAFTNITKYTGVTSFQCVPCMGVIGTPTSGQLRAMAVIEFPSTTSLILKNVNETVYKTITKSSTSTLGENLVLCFMARKTDQVSSTNK